MGVPLVLLLSLIYVISIAIRVFPVVLWGSVIHEFDPHFNFRATKFLVNFGFADFFNWYDDRVWYPLGRSVGTTIYPGLMISASLVYWFLDTVHLQVALRHICVFLAPVLAGFTSIFVFFLTLQVCKCHKTALLGAILTAICPAYISRSTAGSYDNEAIAIPILVLTFLCWIRAIEYKSMFWAASTALSYFGMAISWGGYVFIINLIPLHAGFTIAQSYWQCSKAGYKTSQFETIYAVYGTFYVLATLLVMQVPFIGFTGIFRGEMIASHGVFILLQMCLISNRMKNSLRLATWTMLRPGMIGLGIVLSVGIIVALLMGKLSCTGRILTLLNPTYAQKYLPIIASVGEHQPTPWSSFYASFGPVLFFVPYGLYVCFDKLGSGHVFMILYATLSLYFSGIMIRLLLVLAPAACFLSALGISDFMSRISIMIHASLTPQNTKPNDKEQKHRDLTPPTLLNHSIAPQAAIENQSFWSELMSNWSKILAFDQKEERNFSLKGSSALTLVVIAMALLLIMQVRHSTSMSRKIYSSTSLIIEQRNRTTGANVIYDDFREAFQWLRHNTPEDAKVLSWWDYGYQLSQLANRTVIVDNNTWNNTHIATVGRILMSSEEEALPILESLGVDYILIMFGGFCGMHGDDLDKLPWIVRIAEGAYPDHVIEKEFQSAQTNQFELCENATSAMTRSLFYKMSYHEFHGTFSNVEIESAKNGFDWNRQKQLVNATELTYFTQMFTSTAWVVRIYRVDHQSDLV
uniref:dolichyl-diphosphooligosaccharide--protein glycotransferase n=1 Tax=Albugo laibachii Nc14 TaxID=890382 RepID=F0W981_9STRA|nr:dolichyldiphosphooligosaccharideprotein glycosyltransferase subunit putative [Albugo laibachii Nc14]CCA18340.1 dolichyldiphosphooligosaccharideprotein glycosyltransferase subunit putative [Albugo laibachii Nc14]|eukprot:CCA18340.1 dolichyldiphosphooligosaccharideprotein glycosyltransferase subunit putative [Albugo laibachii Nc14]